MRTTKDALLSEIEDYLRRTQTSETAFGIAVANDWSMVKRLRNAPQGPRASRIDQIRLVIYENPDGIKGMKSAAAIRRRIADLKLEV